MVDRSNEILFEVAENALLVANGGCPFSRKGVISVCASHLSDKQLDKVTDHFDASDKQLIRAIRCNELDHYKDPNRVTSDSNIEHETVHDYGGRFVWELLQNADDAMGEGEITRKGPGLSSGDVILSTCGTNGTALTSWRRWIHSSPASSDQDKQLTVAVCLPLTEQGDAVPHSANLPFHVFFPTEENSGARALVHASFDLAHNRKRVREGDYDDVICREFCKLFQGVLKGIPARTALARLIHESM